jgi:hypothetical protein
MPRFLPSWSHPPSACSCGKNNGSECSTAHVDDARKTFANTEVRRANSRTCHTVWDVLGSRLLSHGDPMACMADVD